MMRIHVKNTYFDVDLHSYPYSHQVFRVFRVWSKHMNFSTPSNVAVAAAVTVATSLGLYLAARPRRDGPPIARMSFLTFFMQLIDPARSISVLKQLAEEEAPVVRFYSPWFLPEFWVIRGQSLRAITLLAARMD